MTLRIFLVAMVSALGLTLPTRSELPSWCQTAELWASKQLADWDTCERSDIAPVATGDSTMVRVAYWRTESLEPVVSVPRKDNPVKASDEVCSPAVPAPPAKIASLLTQPGSASVGQKTPVPSAQAARIAELLRLAYQKAGLLVGWYGSRIRGSSDARWIATASGHGVPTPAPVDSYGRASLSDNLDVALFAELQDRTRAEIARSAIKASSDALNGTPPLTLETQVTSHRESTSRRVLRRVHLGRSRWLVTQRLVSVVRPQPISHSRSLECAPRNVVILGPERSKSGRTGTTPVTVAGVSAKSPLPDLPAMVFAPEVAGSPAVAASTSIAKSSSDRAINVTEAATVGHAVKLTHQAIHAWMTVLAKAGTLHVTAR